MAVIPTSSKSGGASIGFPDVCKTPAPPAPFVPIPYPNSQYQENLKQANAVDAQAKAGNRKAKALQQKAIDSYNRAVGDEPGTMKGVMSATQAVIKGRTVHFAGGSAAVKFEGKSVTRLIDQTSHND